MNRLVVALLVAGLAGPAFAQPRVDPSASRTMRVLPAKLDEAVREFERICLATGFDAARVETAIRASKWRYEKQPGLGKPAPDTWLSGQSIFNFQGPPSQETGSFVPGQCNIEVVVRPVPSDAAIAAALEAALVRTLGKAPPHFDFPGETCWRWQPGPDLVNRLCRVHRPNLAPGQMSWSFQRWTAAGEVRARLVPPAPARP
jgi:hypothetical protein